MTSSSSQQPHPVTLSSVEDLASQFLHRVFRRKKDPIPQNKLPWEDWQLDKDFFRALSQWTLENPQTSLDRVLDAVTRGLENNKDLFQLIPEGPFPARGLVTALAHLVKLGVNVSRAKRDVQDFAKEVIRWVGRVKSAFGSREDGRFTQLAWRNLENIRDLINEICTWAVKRLEDGSWWQIGRGLAIQNEIQEFRGRIDEARALFKDLALINQAKGFDLILQNLRQYFKQQEEQQRIVMAHIERIRKTQDRVIDEFEKQRQRAERKHFLAQTLNIHTVADPTYVSQEKRPCDENTRIEVLDQIRSWKNDISPGTPNFLWLTGDPGCGKSAVTASLTRECKDLGTLWAQFFINRNNVETTNPKSYFPSIARQLASRSPDIAEAIHLTLKQQLSLLDDISADQAAKLFTDTVRQASELDPDQPVVIIFDGLDETNRARLEFTAKTFATLFTALEAYSNVKVFISSRTENEIQRSFFRPLNDKHVKRIHLDTANPSSIRDVSHYIKRNLLNLVSKHDLNWDMWPGDERTRALGERASGLFIWGVTAIKFIEDQLHSHGEECLDDVLNMLTADVLHDINSLYRLILKVAAGREQDEWEAERFRRIVGAIVCLQEPLSLDDLATLLDLRKTPSSKRVDLNHFVRRFRTILVSGTDTITGATIPRIHKSVFEFVTSSSIGSEFHVELSDAHLELSLQCFSYLAAIQESLTYSLSVTFRYASRFWASHLWQANKTGFTSACADCSLPQHSIPTSIQSLRNPMRIHYSSATSTIKLMTTYSSVLLTLDAISGAPIRIPNSEISCIVYAPDGQQIVSSSRDGSMQCWGSNGEWIRTLIEDSSRFLALAFSPDGKVIVSGSEDGLVCRWDYSTGTLVGKPLRGHKARVRCVAYSPRGDLFASACGQGICIIWNAQIGQEVGKLSITDAGQLVLRIVFSNSGRRLCSVNDTGHGIVWDVRTRAKISSWQYDALFPACISFSPKDEDLIAVGGRHGVQMQYDGQKWSIPGSSPTFCLSFLPGGKEIIFGNDRSVSIAEVNKDEPAAGANRIITRGDYRHSSDMRLMVFSPSLDSFAYTDSANKLRVYTLQHTETPLFMNLRANKGLRTRLEGVTGKDQELVRALHSMKAKCNNTPIVQATNNSRLKAIKWYERDVIGVRKAIGTDIWLCVVGDTAIITGYKDGSVIVWDRQIGDDEVVS